MKVGIDENLCSGCGLCEETCPDIFVLEDDIAKVIKKDCNEDDEGCCREAAENCPEEAIIIEE
jgi:ferredoxin